MIKFIFFWIIVAQFVVTFLVTILGIIGWVTIDDALLKKMAAILILEQAAAVLTIFKSTDFFDSKSSVNEEGWDLLATLWKYQQKTAPNQPNARWYLGINPLSPDFRDFATGYSRLRHLDMVDIGQNNAICLSTKGYQYCQQNQKKLKKRKRLFYIE